MSKRLIRFLVNKDNGEFYSQVKDEIALPFKEKDSNGFALIKISAEVLFHPSNPTRYSLDRTNQVPKDVKNYHRKYWGLAPIK